VDEIAGLEVNIDIYRTMIADGKRPIAYGTSDGMPGTILRGNGQSTGAGVEG